MSIGACRSAAWLVLLLLATGCAHLTPGQRMAASAAAEALRVTVNECVGAACQPAASPLRQRAQARAAHAATAAPRHLTLLLDRGPDALLARVHLIRSARRSIELQSFIFENDDSGALVLDELIAAARRGVKVRVLLDQLYGLPEPSLQAALSSFHGNFSLRLYNPTFGAARTRRLQFAAGIICCFRRFNQRMHSKLLLVDGEVAVVGGRNIQDRYFDWNSSFNYRDRDVLIAGPVTAAMASNFEAFWQHPRAVPAEQLVDVARLLLGPAEVERSALPAPGRQRSQRALALASLAGDGDAVYRLLSPLIIEVGRVDFFGDGPTKHDVEPGHPAASASVELRRLVAGTRHELLLQTPYLVLSKAARRTFRRLQRRPDPPKVWVSTNSLAATDAFPVYAMSHKYKRLYLHDLGFRIYEFKPYPVDAPINLAATGALGSGYARLPMFGSGAAGSARGPMPLKRAGVRVGLHAKSMVIDQAVGVVGSHNFDPRSDDLNTESLLVIHDRGFAEALEASIRHDMQPENAWVIVKNPKLPILSGLSYRLGKLSEKLPIFDLWPFAYASSYELKTGCMPVSPDDPRFAACYHSVGAFPEVNLSRKSIYTRLLTVFGAGLVPIL